MEKCIVTLKNVKSFRGREGHGLNADVYVNGKKCCFIMDDANGGEYRYEVYDKELFKDFEAYAKAQPQYPMEFDGQPYLKEGKPVMMDVTIDQLIDAEFDRMEREKETKKLAKKYDNHVIWGVPNAASYTQVKFPHPLSKYPKDKLQEAIDKYKNKFKPGEVFWNTNFAALGINA